MGPATEPWPPGLLLLSRQRGIRSELSESQSWSPCPGPIVLAPSTRLRVRPALGCEGLGPSSSARGPCCFWGTGGQGWRTGAR